MMSWKHTVLGTHIDLMSGFAFKSEFYTSNKFDLKLLRGDNIVQGQLRWDGVQRWPKSEFSTLFRYELTDGDIVLAMDRTWVNAGLKCSRVTQRDLPCLLVQRVARLRGGSDLDTSFLYHTLQSHHFVQYVKSVQTETAIPHISSQQIREFPIHLPSLPEQQKIAAILSSWDRAIELTEKLIAAKQKRKQALMQQLLWGKVRFKEFKGKPWIQVQLSTLLKEVKRWVDWDDDAEYHLLSIRRRSGGMFDRERKFGRDILTKVMMTTEAGDFVIARMQAVHGAVTVTPPECNGKHVSGSYSTLVARDTNRLHMPFLNFLSQTLAFYRLLLLSAYGVTIEKMTFNLSWFLEEKISLPPTVAEQKQIADVFETCQKEHRLLEKRLEALKIQKRGLMQQLLTGRVRVDLNSTFEKV